MFVHSTSVRLHHTDASGRIFFANQFVLAHDAYEAFMAFLGEPIDGLLRESGVAPVIAHAEADYSAPMECGRMLRIEVTIDAVGNRSFTVCCRLLGNAGDPLGCVKTVHVCIDRASGKPVLLPAELRGKLMSHIPAKPQS